MKMILKTEKVIKEYTDYNNHLNVAYYVRIFDIAADVMLDNFNMGGESAKGNKKTTFVAEMYTTYNQEDRLKILKDSFKGEDCYIVSCGPTLTENDQDKVKKLLSDNLTISIKQSYDLYKDLVDIHVYNCANYKEYDYGDKKPIILEAGTSLFELGENDLHFTIRERRFDRSVSAIKNFDDWTFDNNSKARPYGPGIMYESVFFLLEHLGVSSVTTLGWDNKLLDKAADKQHFYDQGGSSFEGKKMITINEVAKNENSVKNLPLEEQMTIDVISNWYDWLLSKGCELKIVSSINPAPEKVQRVKI